MLIEGAIRFILQARQHWTARDDQRACEALIRAQEIVGEILSGFKHDRDPELVKRVAAVYGFVLRSLVEGSMLHDERKLADALRILEIQRDTWRQLCDQLGVAQAGAGTSLPSPAPQVPTALFDASPAGEASGRFSLEA
jgi:flagellar protein FliS